MMEDVGFRDTIGSMSTNPTHDVAAVSKKVAVKGGKGSAGESKLGSAIVGKKRVGMLEEGDQNEPVVDPVHVVNVQYQQSGS